MAAIYRQEIIQDIQLFTSQPKADFYSELFLHLDLSPLGASVAKTGRKGYLKSAMLCAFIVMKCEQLGYITDLCDYLENNRIIAHYCGFDITKPLPSYWTFDRFIRKLDNELLKQVMQSQVLKLVELGIVDQSFLTLDATPVMANTCHNNSKSFRKNKFSKDNQPKADKDCKLGVHTASNQHRDKNYEFYWGYKSHVLCDGISGLPIFEMTTPANVYDSTIAIEILDKTNTFLPIDECYFIADAAYDTKAIYNTIRQKYHGECFVALNPRNTKDSAKIPAGNPICEAGLAMHRDGHFSDKGCTRQKFCCPFKRSKSNSCPCSHRNWNNGKKNRGCTKYVTLPNDYRLSINRDSMDFKRIYALRTEAERYNSRFKATGQERLWVRNAKSTENLNSVAHISLLAIALAAVVTNKTASYRCYKTIKRIA